MQAITFSSLTWRVFFSFLFFTKSSRLHKKTLVTSNIVTPFWLAFYMFVYFKSAGKSNTEVLRGRDLSKVSADWVYGSPAWHNHQHLLPEMRNKTTIFAISTSVKHYTGGPGEYKKAKTKKQRAYKTWELIIHRWHDCGWIIYTYTLRINKFSKVTGYKCNVQKLITYQQKQLKTKFKN